MTQSNLEQGKSEYNSSIRQQIQSQKVDRRNKTLSMKPFQHTNMLMQNMYKTNRTKFGKPDLKSTYNLTEDMLSQGADCSSEYAPKRVIPLNLMNSGNIRGTSITEKPAPTLIKNVNRFQENYLSPYSQKQFQLTNVGGQQFRFGKRNKNNRRVFQNRAESFDYGSAHKSYLQDKLSDIKSTHHNRTNLNSRAATGTDILHEETHEDGSFAGNCTDTQGGKVADEKHYIYLIPDGIDLVKDNYKIYKEDIMPYIRATGWLPKTDIEKKSRFSLSQQQYSETPRPDGDSEQILEQAFSQLLADLTENMRSKKEYVALFTLQGKNVKGLLEIKKESRVYIISPEEYWIGVTGIQTLESEDYRIDENRQKAKQAFLHACEKWIDTHNVQLTGNDQMTPASKHPAALYQTKYG